MKLFCKTCFKKGSINYDRFVIDGLVWLVCRECGYRQCKGRA